MNIREAGVSSFLLFCLFPDFRRVKMIDKLFKIECELYKIQFELYENKKIKLAHKIKEARKKIWEVIKSDFSDLKEGR